MSSIRSDILKWTKLADDLINEQLKPKEKLDKELMKTDEKIMSEKLKKLNMLIKKKYYDKDENTSENKIFQFNFTDKGPFYEFSIPLSILFGPSTINFCAKYWDNFFKEADIDTNFEDNIKRALKQASSINLIMRLNKKLTKEVEPIKKQKEETKENE